MIRWRPFGLDVLLYICNVAVANFPSSHVRQAFYRHCMRLQIGKRVHILSGLWLDTRGKLVIGDNSVINQRCRLDARGGLTIGANVSMSSEVHVLTADHDIHSSDLRGRDRPVFIGDRVFIGTRAIILPGVRIGECAVVAAGAVVTKNVADREIVAGVPANVIGKRDQVLSYNTIYHRYCI